MKPFNAEAYPSFIGYGYTSCIVCHVNAFGNGPLTDYGRALGATTIADKPFFNRNATDQELGDQSGFLGKAKLPDWLRASADYRGLYYIAGFGQPGQKPAKNWVNMRTDLGLVGRFYDEKIQTVFTIGYFPTAQGQAGGPKPDKIVSHEHYISYAVKRNLRVYAGFMDVIYGIRIPDHVSYSRTLPKLTYADGVHGVAGHFAFTNAEVGVHLFAGNLLQDASVRQAGGSVMGEFDLAEKVRLGASALMSTGKVRKRSAGAVHLRAGVGKGSSLLLESGLVSDNVKAVANKTTGAYLYSQTMTRLFRGFHFLFTGEFMSRDAFRPGERRFRVGPGLQYFPMQRLELRMDVWGERSLGLVREYEHSDSYLFLAQVHLWF